MKRFLKWQIFFSLAIGVFRAIPRSYRFGFGKLAAKFLTPFARRLSLINPPPFALDSTGDYLWSVLFTSLTHRGIEFEPKIIFRESERDLKAGAIMVSGHFFLNFFVLRWLFDNGFKQSTVIRDDYDRQKVLGTGHEIDVIKPTAECLMEIKRRVKAGEIISICVDHCEPLDGWQKLDIPNRQIYISDIIFKFAERLEISLVFFGTQLNSNNEIEITSARPVSTKSAEVAAEFGEFLKSLLIKSENK
jgi:hypothetical protein